MDNIGSDNGLAPNMWQAIIWTNDGLIYWGIYASLSLNELTSYFITDNISLKPILHVYERTCNYMSGFDWQLVNSLQPGYTCASVN